MRQKKSVGEYLAYLSVKYEFDSKKFLAALRQAEVGKQINCDSVSVEYRGEIKSKQFFLLRHQSEIVAQFCVPTEFFLKCGDSLGEYMNNELVHRQLYKRKLASELCSIKDVRFGMANINLRAKVLSIAQTKHVITRYGNHADVAMALIGDETGTIKLCLWNEQINAISTGSIVFISSAKAAFFKGERQLTVGSKGIINCLECLDPSETLCLSPP